MGSICAALEVGDHGPALCSARFRLAGEDAEGIQSRGRDALERTAREVLPGEHGDDAQANAFSVPVMAAQILRDPLDIPEGEFLAAGPREVVELVRHLVKEEDIRVVGVGLFVEVGALGTGRVVAPSVGGLGADRFQCCVKSFLGREERYIKPLGSIEFRRALEILGKGQPCRFRHSTQLFGALLRADLKFELVVLGGYRIDAIAFGDGRPVLGNAVPRIFGLLIVARPAAAVLRTPTSSSAASSLVAVEGGAAASRKCEGKAENKKPKRKKNRMHVGNAITQAGIGSDDE